jgi:hypothetical protein
MTSSVENVRRLRETVLVAALALCGGGCDQPLARAHAEVAALTSNVQEASASRDVLEFDLPAEFWGKDDQGRYVVTGFLVGYFASATARPVHTVDVTRNAVVVTERTARIELPRPRLPADVTRYVLRLQMVTTRGSSDWSDPSPPVNVPMTQAARRAQRAQQAAARRRGVTIAIVEDYPDLLSSVERLVTEEAAREQTVADFLTLEELALAVVVADREGVALDRLGKIVKGPPRRSLRRAVGELKPSLRRSNVVQAARGEARRLLAEKSP